MLGHAGNFQLTQSSAASRLDTTLEAGSGHLQPTTTYYRGYFHIASELAGGGPDLRWSRLKRPPTSTSIISSTTLLNFSTSLRKEAGLCLSIE